MVAAVAASRCLLALVAGALAFGLGSAATPSPAGATAAWTPATVSPPSELANLLPAPNSLACPAAGSCVAVGGYSTGSGSGDGLLLTDASGSWSAAAAPVPVGASSKPDVTLASVACGSSTSCVAVGYYDDDSGRQQGLVLTDASGSWSAAEALLPAGASAWPSVSLTSVACPSASSCVAVGTYSDSSSYVQALVLTDASGSWSATEAPLPSGAASNPNAHLGSIACASATSCVAVGSYDDSSGDLQGLLVTDSSGSLSAAKAPMPSGAASNPQPEPASLACASPTSCVAVGIYFDSSGDQQGLVLTDASGSWSAAKAPQPSGALGYGAQPDAVACAASTSCVAVGSYVDSSRNQQGLLLTDASGSWSAAKAPMPSGASSNPWADPRAVTCASATSCVAVGNYIDNAGKSQGVLLTDASGSWSAAAAPLPPGAATNPLAEPRVLACPSATSCIALGYYDDSSGSQQSLVLTDASGSWSAAEASLPPGAAPSPAANPRVVACASSTACVAVGSYHDSSWDQQGLILTGSSGSWSASTAPLPSGASTNPNVTLSAIACASSTSCVAAGSYLDSTGDQQGLVLTDAAGSWTAIKAPMPSGASSNPQPVLSELACPSATSCLAVGKYDDSSGRPEGLILTDASGSWTAAEAPVPPGAASPPMADPTAIDCTSSTSCVAVGSYEDSSGNEQGLVLTDASGSWSAAEAPVPSGAASNPRMNPTALACSSPTSCVAVGTYDDSSVGFEWFETQGLVLTDASGSWTATEAPMPTGAASEPIADPSSLACSSPASCVAVGSYIDSTGNALGFVLADAAGSWTATEAPLPAGAGADPGVTETALACSSPVSCVAVGTYDDSAGDTLGLLLTDAAGSWSATEAPLPAAGGANPGVSQSSVSCAGSGACVSVGGYIDADGGADVLFESAWPTPGCSSSSGDASCAMTLALSVQGGTLALESSPQLDWDYVLDGYDQWESASQSALTGCSAGAAGTDCSGGSPPELAVLDATGSSSGWALSAYLSSSDLPAGSQLDFGGAGAASIGTSLDAPITSPPFGSSAPSTVCDYGSDCTPPTPATSCSHGPLGFTTCPGYPVDLAAGTGASEQVDLYSAAPSSGLGAICFATGVPSAASCAGATPDDFFNLGITASTPAAGDATTVIVLTVSSGP